MILTDDQKKAKNDWCLAHGYWPEELRCIDAVLASLPEPQTEPPYRVSDGVRSMAADAMRLALYEIGKARGRHELSGGWWDGVTDKLTDAIATIEAESAAPASEPSHEVQQLRQQLAAERDRYRQLEEATVLQRGREHATANEPAAVEAIRSEEREACIVDIQECCGRLGKWCHKPSAIERIRGRGPAQQAGEHKSDPADMDAALEKLQRADPGGGWHLFTSLANHDGVAAVGALISEALHAELAKHADPYPHWEERNGKPDLGFCKYACRLSENESVTYLPNGTEKEHIRGPLKEGTVEWAKYWRRIPGEPAVVKAVREAAEEKTRREEIVRLAKVRIDHDYVDAGARLRAWRETIEDLLALVEKP